MSRTAEVDVLVIGAGPSGLLAAAELARHGVNARVVEHQRQPPRQARATAVQPGTLEILAQVGVVDQFLAASVQLPFARVFDANLEPLSQTSFPGVGSTWEYQCSLPQWRTEEILAGRLGVLGGSVERGVSAVSLREQPDCVLVELERADGTAETVAARWVVGAGGAHSVTRESMAGVLEGDTYPGTALVADVSVSCALPRDGSALIASPAGYVLLAPLPDDRWITFIGDLDEAEADRLERDASMDTVAASMQRRVPAVRLTDVGWAAPFRMHHRLVSRLADDRRFLLGDAGHLSSPFGGEGLNSGLHDGHNLAWKLALELRGKARPGLIESFATERSAAAQHVLDVSDRLHEFAHNAVEAARSGVTPAPPTPEQVAALVKSRSMLDVSYPDSPLTGERVGAGTSGSAGLVPGERYPDRRSLTGTAHRLLLAGADDSAAVARLRERWKGLVEVVPLQSGDLRLADLGPSGALLVRPDGYIGFRAVPADGAGLRAVDAHLDSYLVAA